MPKVLFLRPSRFALVALIGATLSLLGQSTASSAAPPSAARPGRPNFVVLMFDDMGFGDLGCYGGEIRTPHIDGLAAGGLRFRRFSNAARCCPTRASLLTGLYQHQVGLTGMGQDLGRQGATIAEHLRASGYATAMAGKWHLSSTRPLGGNESPEHMTWLNHQGYFDRPFSNLATYPISRGFDRHYGPIWGVVDFFDPFSLVEGTSNVKEVPPGYYITDAIHAKAVDYIREMSGSGKPFFLYVAETAPHWPVHALPEDIARYRGRYDAGWHALREERYRRQVALGLIDPQTHPLPALMGRGTDWDALSPEERQYEASLMEAHAAMVDRADQGVGRIIQALKDAGEFDNTVFFVLSDNGASPERYLRTGFDRPSETRDGRKIQYEGTFRAGPETSWGSIGSRWANALNTPFRYWKAESFEGGTHTPLIVHWPAGLRTDPGRFADERGHVIDLAPTCLDLAGASPLATLDGKPLLPFEGTSLAPILRNEPWGGHDALFFEHEGGRAVIARNSFKLVAQRNKPWELYDLNRDATETHDLAVNEPDRVRRLGAAWVAWAGRVGAEVPESLRDKPNAPVAGGITPVELHAGQVLGGAQAPAIANQPLRIEAKVRGASKGGVVASQGAQVQGWSLFVRDARPIFAVRRAGELHEIAGTHPLGDGPTLLTADLHSNGRMTLRVDGVEVANGSALGLIPAQPNDPLIVGDDRMGAVGTYATPHPFGGTIERITLSRPG